MVTTPAAIEFLNIRVNVIKNSEIAGGGHQFVCEPEKITVRKKDTVLNFQLTDPYQLHFVALTIDPDDDNQFSVPSLSCNKRMFTLSDANTSERKDPYHVTLYVRDPKDGKHHRFDPEVINQPETSPPP